MINLRKGSFKKNGISAAWSSLQQNEHALSQIMLSNAGHHCRILIPLFPNSCFAENNFSFWQLKRCLLEAFTCFIN
jgi:hypothetical protein